MIERREILTLIPHAGQMCLLDRVLSWSDIEILCATESHRDPRHPLRRGGTLAALHLIEYGAQATAVHGGLLARSRGREPLPGMLVAVRDFTADIERLDTLAGPLEILARRQIADSSALMYEFTARHGGNRLAHGRVCVILR